MHCAGDATASSHHSAEGGRGIDRDDHIALMNLATLSDSKRLAPLSNEAMPVATRRGLEDFRGDGRHRDFHHLHF
ncbi:MAG: hypothetical protein M3178_01470 [Pseudomonadota bacterium]|nr:hypothetical protein [Pseudomonadota bacterium]